MIKKIECYTLLCDNCGADVNKDSGISGWNDKDTNYDIAKSEDWAEQEGKWYCDKCYVNIDDETDEIIIDK